MALHLKKGPKIALGAVAIVGVIMLLRTPLVLSHLPSTFAKVVTLGKGDVQMPAISASDPPVGVTALPFPSAAAASVPNTIFRGGIWEWSAQNGLLLSNGGPETTKGSLMEKFGVNLTLERQDDTDKMGEGIVTCAKELHDGAKQCSTGYNFVVIMSGGVPNFSAKLNPQLAKLGPEYKLKTIGAVGRSNGEDSFMAPASFKSDPHSIAQTEMTGPDGSVLPVRGLLVEGVVLDDDWNIAQQYAAVNGIPNNPDETTFDPDAINWINASDYNVAAANFVGDQCEDRTLVSNGHSTMQKVHVCANGAVTWTPGDVVAATKRGGVVKVASSKNFLMGAVIIGPGKFFSDNAQETTELLASAAQGGDQVRAFDSALHKACQIAALIYNDQGDTGYSNGDYWYKYAKGVTQPDAKGVPIQLGGSAVFGLTDEQNFFGITAGKNDDFRSIYNVFAGIDNKEYASRFKSTPIPSASDVELKTYIYQVQDLISNAGQSAGTVQQTDYSSQSDAAVIGDRSYSINFATGSAQPLPDGVALLQQLKDSLAVTQAAIEVNGDTDNTGNEQANRALSLARAQAVESFLMRAAPSSFPSNRFTTHGYGSSKPVASNATAEGKAQNRRVEIILHSN